ncbi:hypothetical protein JCM16303_003810 [Sporobolomyces ruberrimus]
MAPRQQPRRASQASAGSYTSYFSSNAEGSDSCSTPSSSNMSSSRSNSPPPSKPLPQPAVQDTAQAPPPTATSLQGSETESSRETQAVSNSRREVEAILESLYTATVGPKHSIKEIKADKRNEVGQAMEEAGFEQTLKKWWLARQWKDKKKERAALEEETIANLSGSSLHLGFGPSKPISVPKASSTNATVSIHEPIKKTFGSQQTSTKNDVSSKSSSARFDTDMFNVEQQSFPDRTYVRPVDMSSYPSAQHFQTQPRPVNAFFAPTPTPRSTLSRSPSADRRSVSAPSMKKPRLSVPSVPEPFFPETPQSQEARIEIPAMTLIIGSWSRTTAFDPAQLSVVYSPATDSFIFSTQHLEFIYHLHLPVASIVSLVLFHSLAYSRSVLLINRDPSSPLQPEFTQSSAPPESTNPAFASPAPSTLSTNPISDFTPERFATSTSTYALELTETSRVPALLEEIDQLSTNGLSLEEKFFVGPWKEDVFTREDLASRLGLQTKKGKKKRGSEESNGGGGGGVEAIEGLKFKYTGKDERKVGQELWARKWF